MPIVLRDPIICFFCINLVVFFDGVSIYSLFLRGDEKIVQRSRTYNLGFISFPHLYVQEKYTEKF